jgi:hypothetical protein
MGKNTRLAATCTGEHQQLPWGMSDRFFLL